MKEKDIVTDILDRVEHALRECLGSEMGFEQSAVDAITSRIRDEDSAIRAHWGRSEAYIPARAPAREQNKQKALEEVSRSGRAAEAASRNGISRSTMYRLLKLKR